MFLCPVQMFSAMSSLLPYFWEVRGHAVAQLVQALRYSWKDADLNPNGVIAIFH